jgi:hypothetical protein
VRTTAIRLSDETITALAMVLDRADVALEAEVTLTDPDARLAYEMGVVKLTRAAADIVHASSSRAAKAGA